MRDISARVLGFGLTVVLLIGQQSTPVFRAGTKLVEVTVTVLDKKGNAVAGLEPADFTVLDEGKPRAVSLFRFDGAPAAGSSSGTPSSGTPAAATPAVTLPSGVFTNKMETAGNAPHNITALVLDAINTPPQQNTLARAQMMRYLRALAPETRVAIFLMGKQLRILHDFTDDPASLRAKLDKATLGMPLATVTDFRESIVEAEAFVNMFPPEMQKAAEEIARNNLEVEAMANAASRRYRLEQSLAAMEALGQHLAGIPGRKSVVWIGGGLSMFTITGALGMGVHGSTENYEAKVRATSQKLAQQGIILYIVDSKGIDLPTDQQASSRGPVPVRGRGRFEPQMDSEAISNDPHPAMELMASITGGRYIYNTNDLSAGFKQTAADIQGSYTLGFYMPGDPDDKWHKLKVKVKRSGVNVRHREGYLAELTPAQPVEWSTERWHAAFSNPVGSTVIPMTAKCERAANGEMSLSLSVDSAALQFRPDGENLKADLEIAIADVAPDGAAHSNRTTVQASVPAAKWEEARKQAFTYQRQWKPMENTDKLRVIVHDVRGGQYGSLDVPLNRVGH